jgi:hypothetical protein
VFIGSRALLTIEPDNREIRLKSEEGPGLGRSGSPAQIQISHRVCHKTWGLGVSAEAETTALGIVLQ